MRQTTDPRVDAFIAGLDSPVKEVAEALRRLVGEAAPETPVQEESRMEGERYAAAKASLEADPNIKTLQTMFGAELNVDSIEPITPSQSE